MSTERITAAHYGLYRALLGAYLIVHFLMLLPYAGELFAAGGSVATASLSPFHELLPNPLWLLDEPWVAQALLITGAVCGLAILVGLADRIGALLAALILAWLFQRNPLIANPSLPLLGWLLVLHLFVPVGNFTSLGARWRGSAPDWRLPAHLYLAVWIVLSLSYSHSGWTKLASPSWVDGQTIRLVLENPLARDYWLRECLLATPPWVLQALTWGVLWVELLFAPLALWSRTRPWVWLAMLLAQFGFLTLLNFADLTFPMLLVHLLCFDPAWLRRAEVSDPGVLLFDGDCAFCHASVRLALHEDRHVRLRFAPLQGTSAKRLLNGRVMPDDGDSIVLVDEHGQIARKSAAVIGVLMRLGGLWLLPAWLLRSLPRRLADAGYDLVGRWRYRLAGKVSGSCPWRPEYNGRVLP
ncbi:MAG: DCC1-like thiol-disulfide oxidoreductase family protein [Lysobacterales bacterium]